jgi:membrane associated rhomboid family serine protease
LGFLQELVSGAFLAQPRQPIFNVPAVIGATILVLGLVHAVRVLLLPGDVDRTLLWTFAFVPARYDTSAFTATMLPGGWLAEIWSFVTYAALHSDVMHLGVNSVWLLAFGSPLARRFGSGRFLLFFAVTIAAGALVYLLVHSGELSLMIGASAGVSGTMAGAARFVFEPGGALAGWDADPDSADRVPAAPLLVSLRNPRVVTFLAIWTGLNLLFGVGSLSLVGAGQSVAWEAHIGGFLAGLLLFSVFDPIKQAPANQDPRTLH